MSNREDIRQISVVSSMPASNVLVIEYCDLKIIWNLVLGIWDFSSRIAVLTNVLTVEGMIPLDVFQLAGFHVMFYRTPFISRIECRNNIRVELTAGSFMDHL